MNIILNTASLKKLSRTIVSRFGAYRSFIFFLFLTSLYGYIIWRINVLSSAPPTQAQLDSAQHNVERPKISDATINQLKSLQDNSVRVQTLFNNTRQNPFQE